MTYVIYVPRTKKFHISNDVPLEKVLENLKERGELLDGEPFTVVEVKPGYGTTISTT